MSKVLVRLSLALMLTISTLSVASAQEGPDGSKVYVKVSQNREISGTPVDLAEVKVTTSFGEVAIPLAKIDGIKMHADANDSAVIAFKNGDLVTGKITLEKIVLKTDWGTAHVDTTQIETVTNNRNARFFSDGSGVNKSWRFTNAATPTTTRVLQGTRQ